MNRLLRFLALGATIVALAGCTTDDYRYKLTLTLDTPDGPKTAFNVVAMHVVGWEYGVAHHMRGEALFIDLGTGRRPLVALLTAKHPPFISRKNCEWSDIGPYFLGGFYRGRELHDAPLHEPNELRPEQLPDLLTFADFNDPGSAIAVDPDHLEATLGAGMSWRSITIELTDEPLTSGLKEKLPWLAAYRPMLDPFQTDPRLFKLAEVSGGTPLPWIDYGVTPGKRPLGIKDFVRND